MATEPQTNTPPSFEARRELSEILESHQISEDPGARSHYGKDWTTYFVVNPSLIVFPKTTPQVQSLVHWAIKHQIPLVPSGGRTGLSGGAVATQGEVVVSLEKMNQILEFTEEDQILHVQAGVSTEEVQKKATQLGLFFPIDFAARGSAQIGGNIATNAGGIKVLRYGLMRDWVLGLTVVTGSGDILNLNKGLVKNATGYDFRHLFMGSEGTLGIVTEALIRLAPDPGPGKVLLMGVSSINDIMKVFKEFRRLPLRAFEMFSDRALVKVMEHKKLPPPAPSLLSLGPSFFVLAEVDCHSEHQETSLLETFEHVLTEGWVLDGVLSESEAQATHLWQYRENIAEAISSSAPYKNDISVRVSRVPQFVQALDEVLQRAYPDWELVLFGHIGDGNLHVNILKPPSLGREEFFAACQKMDQIIFGLLAQYEGSVSAEHGVGITKKPFLKYTRSESEIHLMRELKKLFDPQGILNPGKLLSRD